MPEVSSVQIRPILARDIPAVCAIIALHSSYDAACAKASFERELAGIVEVRSQHIVAVICGGIIGVSGWRADELCGEGIFWLGWTYVQPDHRRHGIGSVLLNAVLQEIRQKGARKLYLDTGATGYEAALAFYTKHGFVHEARLPDYYSDGEDALILARPV